MNDKDRLSKVNDYLWQMLKKYPLYILLFGMLILGYGLHMFFGDRDMEVAKALLDFLTGPCLSVIIVGVGISLAAFLIRGGK